MVSITSSAVGVISALAGAKNTSSATIPMIRPFSEIRNVTRSASFSLASSPATLSAIEVNRWYSATARS